MLKRLAFVLTVCACVGVAYGAAVKIRSFDVFPPESAEADGMAILNYASGQDKTVVQIIISGFTPNTTYEAVLISPTHSDLPSADITTDSQGHGTLHMSLGNNPLLNEGADYSDSEIEIGFLLTDANTDNDDLRAVGWNSAP